MGTSRHIPFFIIAIILLGIAACVLFLFTSGRLPHDPVVQNDPLTGVEGSDQGAYHPEGSHTMTFTSADGAEITIMFSAGGAALNGLGYAPAYLTQVVSASGARYVDQQGLEVWNKGSTVTISKDDEIIFTGEAVTSTTQQLLSGTWVWREAFTSGGERHTPDQEDAFTVTFEKDGRVHGTTDCNGFSGTYAFKNGILTFGPLAQTKMYCEGSEEMEFMGMMATGPFAIVFAGMDTLMLRFADNVGSITFERE